MVEKLFSGFLLLLLISTGVVRGQLNISGTVPATFYTPVTNFPPCTNSIDVLDASTFAAGDHVIIIQMQGATIDASNSASYGNVTAINGSGLWEKAIIDRITGNTVFFTKDLVNRASYNLTGKIQMVKIYFSPTDVNVTATLRPMDWNGTVGGVVAVEATNNLNLAAGIDASNNGFRGGLNTQFCPNNCNFSQNNSDYFYATGDYRGSLKGEGAAAFVAGKELGRGAQANGGGGGNDHNSGGAGGGNAVAGGQGGNNAEPGAFNCKGNNNFGVGGKALAYGTTRMWLGGGGGAGHGNNNGTVNCGTGGNSGFGGDGGGIVILMANNLNGGGQTINTSGGNGLFANFDGGGGGGSGGVVFINAASHSSTLTIQARGGNGGGTSSGTGNRCYGPGGGGAGGVVLSNAALPGTVSVSLTAGIAGLVTMSSNGCNNTSTTALAGTAGTTITGVNVIMGTVDPGPGCVLPVTYINWEGEAREHDIVLNWATSRETNSSHYEVLRSVDGTTFQSIGVVQANGNTDSRSDYEFVDDRPFRGTLLYKVKQVDLDGAFSETTVLQILYNPEPSLLNRVYPNPVPEGQSLMIEWLEMESGNFTVSLTDAMGKTVLMTDVMRAGDGTPTEINISGIANGMYFLHVRSAEGYEVRRVAIGTKN